MGEKLLCHFQKKRPTQYDREETIMDKNRWVIGATFSIFLCATGCSLGQLHHPIGQSVAMTPVPLTPALKAREDKKWRLDQAAIAALDTGEYAEAEDDARQSIAVGQDSGLAQEVLASSLNAQGRTQEALQAYKVIADGGGAFSRNLVPYARLLLESGQWAQAVIAYNTALTDLSFGEMMKANSRFSAEVPQPRELAVALHIAQGLVYASGDNLGTRSKHEEGMREFAQALKLQPNSALTNYYYGFGWQQLDLRSRARAVYAPQAKAALQKAAALGSGDVKKKAEEALRGG